MKFRGQSFLLWEFFLHKLFKHSSRCYILDGEEGPTYQNTYDELERFSNIYQKHFGKKGLICKVTESQDDVKLTCEILEKVFYGIKDRELNELVTCEIIGKVLAYRNLKEGQNFLIPSFDKDQKCHLINYRVDRVFDLWKSMIAFGLVPDDRSFPPILTFRGTDFSLITEGGRAAIINDLDPKGPGRTLFAFFQVEIHKWLKAQADLGEKARVIGHSLGGAFVVYTLIQGYDLLHKEATSYAFNFPGVNDDLKKIWENIPQERRPAFRGFVVRGDFISKFGKLFGETYELSLDKKLSPVRAHELMIFAQQRVYQNKVAIEKENACASRKFYSKIQKKTGSFIYQVGLTQLFPRQS